MEELRTLVRATLIERLNVGPHEKSLLLKIDNEPYHMMAIDDLDQNEIEMVDDLIQQGYLKFMPANLRFPNRITLSSGGSHATGTFDMDTLHDELPRRRRR